MPPKMKLGRPTASGEPETVKVIHVGLDADSADALARLEAVLVGPKRGRTSIAVRRALHEAASRTKKAGSGL